MKSAISVKDLTKKYDGKELLKGVNLTLAEGTKATLIGNNGSGKTTLLKIVSGIIKFASGNVEVLGHPVSPGNKLIANQIGVALHEPYLLEDFSPEEHFRFLLKFRGLPFQRFQNRLEYLIDLFEFNQLTTRISKLSAGNRRKVSLISTLLHEPDLLLLDEPFANLDVRTSGILLDYLKNEIGRASVLVTSHNIGQALDYSDTIHVLDDGIIAKVFNPNEDDNIEDSLLTILRK